MTEVVNIVGVDTEPRDERPDGYLSSKVTIGPILGAAALGATVYDLRPGQSVCPYHYEHGREEWLIVVRGRPTLRHPDGEDELEPWDAGCFPEGPDGAHKLTNSSADDVRVVMLSTKGEPVVFVYPDSGKVAVGPLGKLFRLSDEVDYWDGETS